MISSETILGDHKPLENTRLFGEGPEGRLPLSEETLRDEPSGTIFGMIQSAGMGWNPDEVGRPQYLILSTHGGLRAEDGTPIALGYHTGHWEVNLLVRRAAETLRAEGGLPFAAYCSDPCDGRTQGNEGMMDSLPYRNDAAQVLRRLVRSLPLRQGLMGISTCDKGTPAMMMTLAGIKNLPGILVPGGVTLPTPGAEDLGKIQSLGARFAHDIVDLEYAATMGCKVCGSPGGGCHFMGTAATSQVVAEALGLTLPHSALAPSGEPVWLDVAHRSALALLTLKANDIPVSAILTQKAVENAMLVHAAVGGSTNLLLHIPAIAHAAGLAPPNVEDWRRVNQSTPRLVDVLPNGPHGYYTAQLFMAGGVPEVMLHLRDMDLLHLDVMTASGQTLGDNLDWWEQSERRRTARERLVQVADIDPDDIVMNTDSAHKAGLTSTVVFPTGNLAPDGSVIKATAIDPTVIKDGEVYHHRGPARVFTTEQDAIRAVKGQNKKPVKPNDVIILIGSGPMGTGMEETLQLTGALKFIPWGKHVPIITDGRFSGVSTGACIGHVGPEALAGGPIGKVRDGDIIDIVIDRRRLEGTINVIDVDLTSRLPHPDLQPHPHLPDDTRLWAALQEVCGGTWAGCIYDTERIIDVLNAGLKALGETTD